ncbi:MAG TPA: 3-dehydroquinate synthase, partial [Massilibacterium sp.]|nr:3-dehydroquinate synthase [Massilibacterium sp.]
IRSFLNFGHTLGHAIEATLGYGKITHGEAIVIGMMYAMRVSEDFYSISLPIAQLENYFQKFHYQLTIPSECVSTLLLEKMKADKKSEEGAVKMVLMKQIGEVEVQFVSDEQLLQVMDKGGGDIGSGN